MFFLPSDKDTVRFTGTYEEFVDLLHKKGFWESEEEYQRYLKRDQTIVQNPLFDHYSVDFSEKIIGLGSGVVYFGSGPSYPDQTVFELNSEGFTQEEINQAFSKALKELHKLREKNKTEGYKDFFLKKINR